LRYAPCCCSEPARVSGLDLLHVGGAELGVIASGVKRGMVARRSEPLGKVADEGIVPVR
jgi:hypothetical protein